MNRNAIPDENIEVWTPPIRLRVRPSKLDPRILHYWDFTGMQIGATYCQGSGEFIKSAAVQEFINNGYSLIKY